jgi:hypothetical protein
MQKSFENDQKNDKDMKQLKKLLFKSLGFQHPNISRVQNIPRFRPDYNPIYSYSISSFTTAYTVYWYVSIEENHQHDHQS